MTVTGSATCGFNDHNMMRKVIYKNAALNSDFSALNSGEPGHRHLA